MHEPRCPLCGSVEHVTRVAHPTGEWLCSACPCTFDGGGQEYLAMGPKRTVRQRRNEHPPEPMHLPRSTNKEHA